MLSSTTHTCFSGSYGLMYTECGRRRILSHCVHVSMMLPLASATTMQCSHFASTPSCRYGGPLIPRTSSFPSHEVSHFRVSWSVPPVPGSEACVASRHSPATGKLMLG